MEVITEEIEAAAKNFSKMVANGPNDFAEALPPLAAYVAAVTSMNSYSSSPPGTFADFQLVGENSTLVTVKAQVMRKGDGKWISRNDLILIKEYVVHWESKTLFVAFDKVRVILPSLFPLSRKVKSDEKVISRKDRVDYLLYELNKELEELNKDRQSKEPNDALLSAIHILKNIDV